MVRVNELHELNAYEGTAESPLKSRLVERYEFASGFLDTPRIRVLRHGGGIRRCNHRLIWSTNQSGLEGLRRGFKHIGSP